MKNKLIVVEDFFDDPDSVRRIALDTINSLNCNGLNDIGYHYPGHRSGHISDCAPHIFEELKSKVEFHTRVKFSFFKGYFHMTNGSHGCGSVHYDRYDLAGVVYLNEFYPQNTGTKVVKSLVPGIRELPELLVNFVEAHQTKDYDIVQNQAKLKKELNKKYYKDSIVVHGEYNRLVVYDGRMLHSPDNYFGFNLYNSRMTIAFFGNV